MTLMKQKPQVLLTEAEMKQAEARFPLLALKATRQAARQAHAHIAHAGGSLVQAKGNQLVQISSTGSTTVLKTLPAGIPVMKGLRLRRPKP